MNHFVYSGDKLIDYLRQCLEVLSAYIQSPRPNISPLLSVLYSYYAKHGVSSMSILTLNSFYELCHQHRLTLRKMKKMDDKLAVVKNLFHDDNEPKHVHVETPGAAAQKQKIMVIPIP